MYLCTTCKHRVGDGCEFFSVSTSTCASQCKDYVLDSGRLENEIKASQPQLD